MKVLGERIRRARLRAGISRECVAESVDTHPGTVGRWERGEDQPRFMAGVGLVKLLNTSGFYLAGLVDDPEPSAYLSQDERRMIACYRALPSELRPTWLGALQDLHHAVKVIPTL